MKLKTPPQRAELVSKTLCRPALSFGSTTNAKRRGRTLTVALSIEILAMLHSIWDTVAGSDLNPRGPNSLRMRFRHARARLSDCISIIGQIRRDLYST